MLVKKKSSFLVTFALNQQIIVNIVSVTWHHNEETSVYI